MSNLTINDYWRVILPSTSSHTAAKLVKGWSVETARVKGFQEAPLELSAELNPNADPTDASIVLVSAPGGDNQRAALEGMAKKSEEFLAGGGKLYVEAAERSPLPKAEAESRRQPRPGEG